MKHCIGCGKKCRRVWPKYEPAFCSQACAASKMIGLITAGEPCHCDECGEYDCRVHS